MSSGASSLFSNKLTDFDPWCGDNSNFSGQIALFLEDSLLTSYHHSGSFAFDSLLLKYCRSSDCRVILIITGQTSSHYQSILMKNLLDVNVLHNAGRLDCYRLIPEFMASESISTMPWMAANPLSQGKSSSATSSGEWTKNMTWDMLVQWQKDHLSGTVGTSESKTIVLIDDLDAYELFAPTTADARYWVQQWMRALTKETSPSIIDSLVAFGRIRDHEDTTHTDATARLSALHMDRAQPLLTTYLTAHAQWIIAISALKTGLSSIVHGTITIQQQDFMAERPCRRRKILQYRALDSGVQCVSSD